ncbi:hypothetical protein KC352_g33906, partial [Hortaea werneckii]
MQQWINNHGTDPYTPTDTLEDVTLEDAELANVTVENPTYSPSGLLTGGLLIN